MAEVVRDIVHVLVMLLVPLIIAGGLVWAERRLLAVLQDRQGPNRVGPVGLLQVLADTVKYSFDE